MPSSAFGHDSRKGRRFNPAARMAAFIALSLWFAQNRFAAEAKLYPVDEAAKDPSLVAFRYKLIQAAKTRDLNFVLSVLDPKIKNSFGGNDGIEGFKRIWEPAKPETGLWLTLLKVLSMGGSFYRHNPEWGFAAPYVHSRWPSDFDPYDYAAITGRNVNIRAAPNASAPVLARLSCDIVKLEGYLPGEDEIVGAQEAVWVKIKTQAGQIGYVSRRFIYSPISHRVRFVKREGKWWIISLLAGD